jgi:hypothetical protein
MTVSEPDWGDEIDEFRAAEDVKLRTRLLNTHQLNTIDRLANK